MEEDKGRTRQRQLQLIDLEPYNYLVIAEIHFVCII